MTDGNAQRDKIIDLEEIQGYWQDVAPWYDGDLTGADRPGPSRSSAEIRAWELQFRRIIGPPPLAVLDVGAGTGKISLLLAALGYQVTAVDAAERMLDRARYRAEMLGLRLDIRQAWAAELPFENATFDAVTSRHVLWTQPEPERTLIEWARVTRPGGRIITLEGPHGQRPSAADWARNCIAGALVRLRGKPSGFLDDTQRLAQLPLGHVIDVESYRNVFRRAGLQRVLVEELRGIHALANRHTPLVHRIWPSNPLYLIEGTVPNTGSKVPL